MVLEFLKDHWSVHINSSKLGSVLAPPSTHSNSTASKLAPGCLIDIVYGLFLLSSRSCYLAVSWLNFFSWAHPSIVLFQEFLKDRLLSRRVLSFKKKRLNAANLQFAAFHFLDTFPLQSLSWSSQCIQGQAREFTSYSPARSPLRWARAHWPHLAWNAFNPQCNVFRPPTIVLSLIRSLFWRVHEFPPVKSSE